MQNMVNTGQSPTKSLTKSPTKSLTMPTTNKVVDSYVIMKKLN